MSDIALAGIEALPTFAEKLSRLACNPPQVLLIEGGSESLRLDFALFWAMAANCPSIDKRGHRYPCLGCPVCKQIAANENMDIWLYDGRISNKQDEEKPGPIKAMRMENIRNLKTAIATKPHGDGKRIAIFQGISLTREEAQNSLLKICEEPCDTTLFVLLTPMRQQILPTLISRAHCLTLPWQSNIADQSQSSWDEAIAGFLATGQGFLDTIGTKGTIDANIASDIILSCQKAFIKALSHTDNGSLTRLEKIFLPFFHLPKMATTLSVWFIEAQSMLQNTVTPARVLEAFFTKLFLLLKQNCK